MTADATAARTLTVGEVKVFPDRGGHTDPQQLAVGPGAGRDLPARARPRRRRARARRRDRRRGRRLPRLHLAGIELAVGPRRRGPHLSGDPRRARLRSTRGGRAGVVRDDDFAADNPALDRARSRGSDRLLRGVPVLLRSRAPVPRSRARAATTRSSSATRSKRLLGDTTITRALELLNGADAGRRPRGRPSAAAGGWMTAVTRDRRASCGRGRQGRPLPRYDTIHHAIVPPNEALSSPSCAWPASRARGASPGGRSARSRRSESVPDGRVRDDVAVLCAAFAEDLLAHLRVHNWTFDPRPTAARRARRPAPGLAAQRPARRDAAPAQLHVLADEVRRREPGDPARARPPRGLDVSRHLARRQPARRERQRSSSATSYVFPAQDARTAHLGFQLAWLTTAGDRDARIAAAADAEGLTVSPTMDPALERDDAQRPRRARGRPAVGTATTSVAQDDDDRRDPLRAELRRRWKLTEQAYRPDRRTTTAPSTPASAA